MQAFLLTSDAHQIAEERMRIDFSRALLACTAVAVLAGTGWARDLSLIHI